MVKALTVYRCEICKTIYDEELLAQQCEGLGHPPLLPVGTIFQVPGRDHAHVVFAVHANAPDGHTNQPMVWVTRDDDGPDTTGQYVTVLPKKIKAGFIGLLRPNVELTAFGRMVAALEQKDIKPYVWSGRFALPHQVGAA